MRGPASKAAGDPPARFSHRAGRRVRVRSGCLFPSSPHGLRYLSGEILAQFARYSLYD